MFIEDRMNRDKIFLSLKNSLSLNKKIVNKHKYAKYFLSISDSSFKLNGDIPFSKRKKCYSLKKGEHLHLNAEIYNLIVFHIPLKSCVY